MTRFGWIWIASLVYAALYTALGTLRYVSYHSGSDLGLFTQSIAGAFHGFANTTEGGSHFTYHFSPILLLCAPLLLAAHSPLALVAIQAVAGALAAPPLYMIARTRVGDRLALGVALVALVYPPLAGVTFTDFHENGFVPAATLWLLWAVDARRWGPAAICLLVVLGIKEDQAPIVAFAALVGAIAFAYRRDRAGLLFAGGALLLACATFAFFFEVVRPWAGATDAWGPSHFYGLPQSAPPPGTEAGALLGRLGYFTEAVAPLALTCLLSPAFVLALPGFAEVLLSREPITYTMGQHYAAVWIGYVLFAFALGIARVHATRPRLARNLVVAAGVACVSILLFASPTHWRRNLSLPNAHDAEVDHILAALPPNLAVGTQESIYSHLGFDPNADLGLGRKPPFALFDTTQRASYYVEKCLPELQAGTARKTWRLVWSRQGVVLYQRVSSATVRINEPEEQPNAARKANEMDVGKALLERAHAAGAASIAVVGTSKNAGKTVTVAALCRALEGESFGVCSVGRDGEGVDALESSPKPRLFLAPNAYIATAAALLPRSPAVEILDLMREQSALGPIALARVRAPGFFELSGPPQASSMRRVIAALAKHGASPSIVDGAVDRIAALRDGDEAVVVAVGASGAPTLAHAIDDVAALVARLSVPRADPKEESVRIEGALTVAAAAALVREQERRQIVVADPTRIAFGGRVFLTLAAQLDLRCERTLLPVACTVAPIGSEHSFEPRAFVRGVAQRTGLPAYDVYAGAAAA